jgi:hypothetical protein
MWDISMDQVLPRRSVHERYGGSQQGGIAPSAVTANVLLFSSPSGKRYGYDFDGERSDGAFHYTGEGQIGDQVFTKGNAAVRDHVAQGRRLRMFQEVKRSTVRYLGEYRVDPDHDHYRESAPDRDGEIRSVIVFRLLPVDAHEVQTALAPEGPPSAPVVRDVPVESHVKETFQVDPTREPTTAERREAALVQRYTAWLEAGGATVTRKEIRLPDSGCPLYSDLFDGGAAELVEAKSSGSRHHVRLGIGQVLDYARYVEHKSLALLLPIHPGDDLVDLITRTGIACIFEAGKGDFQRVDPST